MPESHTRQRAHRATWYASCCFLCYILVGAASGQAADYGQFSDQRDKICEAYKAIQDLHGYCSEAYDTLKDFKNKPSDAVRAQSRFADCRDSAYNARYDMKKACDHMRWAADKIVGSRCLNNPGAGGLIVTCKDGFEMLEDSGRFYEKGWPHYERAFNSAQAGRRLIESLPD